MLGLIKSLYVFIFSFCLLVLFPDNSLLAQNVKEAIVENQSENSGFNLLIFRRDKDEIKFNEKHLQLYKEQAILAAENNNPLVASIYAEYYIKYSSEVGFIDSGHFTKFKDSDEFAPLFEKYSFNFSWLYFFYLFSSLIGFFIFLLILVKKQKDKVSTVLIGTFVLINALFIFQIFLFLTNLKFRTPHILYLSSVNIYLYGPLIYFYFKRVTLNYKFKKSDLVHFLPTVLILIVFIPIFLLPGYEKMNIMLDVGSFDARPYKLFTVSTKIISLLVYGCLLLRLYLKRKNEIELFSPVAQSWLRNMVIFVEFYVVSYLVYGVLIMQVHAHHTVLFHIQVAAIATMVLYIGYNSYLRPNMFTKDQKELRLAKKKYKKSSLTPSFSEELKEKLVYLLETEKVYKKSNINLDYLAEKLDTTRHNTSQVINENFNVSFFELINTYRIQETMEILKKDTDRSMNIIEVAYEVGFNNKVSFNKSFKKHLSQTPSQYLGALRSE
ncbi:MAG: AraC-like DNA-binding protein [Sediminicola sp.]|jgi:AraC-like DNA-binding protein|tara:strand:- start:563 stop:2050 length:1488 start_codon:yes stop_codon:yes gene_type:complete